MLEAGGARVEAVLKEIAPDPHGPTLERRFYEELAPAPPAARAARSYASGPLPGRCDGWMLLEPLPRAAPTRLRRARLAALAARRRARARPLPRARAGVAAAALRPRRAREPRPRAGGRRAAARAAPAPPALRFLVGERALDAAVALAPIPSRSCAPARAVRRR